MPLLARTCILKKTAGKLIPNSGQPPHHNVTKKPSLNQFSDAKLDTKRKLLQYHINIQVKEYIQILAFLCIYPQVLHNVACTDSPCREYPK